MLRIDIGACPHGAYILVMLKLVGFTGISLSSSKYLLCIRFVPATWNVHSEANRHSPLSQSL